jgi:hypothetical protein
VKTVTLTRASVCFLVLKDIGFGVLFQNKVKGTLRRCDSHEETQKGSVVCAEAGTYSLRWDNTYSHWNKKFLLYRVWTDDKVDEQIGAPVVAASQDTGVVVDDDDGGKDEEDTPSEPAEPPAPQVEAPAAPVEAPQTEAPQPPVESADDAHAQDPSSDGDGDAGNPFE